MHDYELFSMKDFESTVEMFSKLMVTVNELEALGKQGSACVEVMTTLHGSTPSSQRCIEGCVPLEGMIASARDPLTHPFCLMDPP